ncbi:hypothetical protein [Shewanella sp. Isolate11]|uniref:tellurite resistance TerB family protein n=1 Tax=Shewanella sp. Isolate11 TaxID=2908530 RepID=UPI001EFD6836|nr:hypothetical protein [Shewanella sp. Isolate11]MCG9697432.1 hypothetical protein [Shewanella sp. Isolate11]
MLDILDVINKATKEANSFENHAAKHLTLEERLLYLQGLALVMNADGEIHPEEKEYIRILIKSFEMDESILESFEEFAQCPDKDTVQAFFRTFRRRQIAQLFLFDALTMTRRDDSVDEREKAVVDKIAEELEVLKGTYQDIFDLFCHIKNKDWAESAWYFSSHLLNPEHFRHLLDYYEVDFDDLLERTEKMRNKRVLQIFKSRLNLSLETDELEVELHNDIVLPIIQTAINRGEIQVFMDKLVFSEEQETELSEVGFGYLQECKSLYLKHEKIISDRNTTLFLSNFLGLNSVDFYEFIFGGDNLIRGEIDKECNRRLNLSSSFEDDKLIAVGDKLFKYINNGSYSIEGQSEIYSSEGRVNFYEYVNQGLKDKTSDFFRHLADFDVENRVFQDTIKLDYSLDDQDSKGTLEEIHFL